MIKMNLLNMLYSPLCNMNQQVGRGGGKRLFQWGTLSFYKVRKQKREEPTSAEQRDPKTFETHP